MEKQARRRIHEGGLSPSEVERLGIAFSQLDTKVSDISRLFNIDRRDLELNFSSSPLVDNGGELFSLVDLLDKVIEKGLVVFGDLGISVADIELINVQLRLIVSPTRNRKSVIRKSSKRKNSVAIERRKDGNERPVSGLSQLAISE